MRMLRSSRGLMAVGAIVATLAGCVSPGGGATGGGVPRQSSFWAAGDSLSVVQNWPMQAVVPVFTLAVSGSGFVGTSAVPYTIVDTVTTYITEYGVPSRLVIMGGVGDIGQHIDPAVVIAAMSRLDDSLTARNVNVWWVTEPSWHTNRPGMDVINQWVRTRPRVADCAGSVQNDPGNTFDGIHLTLSANAYLASCIVSRTG